MINSILPVDYRESKEKVGAGLAPARESCIMVINLMKKPEGL